ncbi:hypothetical protein Asd1617_03651 [Shigella dysenteriae 1617]|uniref:Uncharacterized protein n=1 Tax=Shigella dysenteriae 1617 TaxID=754093 RepID=A0A0A6ZWJ8_SHIDY|nr:hypothetical protein Asd1617_03651 [Shigella dysenteriae 1617]
MAPQTLREALRVHFYIQKENKRGQKTFKPFAA